MSLIREAFPDTRRRVKALGFWAVGGAVGGAVAAAVGQLLGGLLTTVDWRLVFAINLPVCAGLLVLLTRVSPSPQRPSPFDWAGQLLAVGALAALMYGLTHGGSVGFSSPSVVVSLVVAAAGIVGFLWVQVRVRHPMMPLILFRSTGMIGLTPLHAGLVFLPAAPSPWRPTS